MTQNAVFILQYRLTHTILKALMRINATQTRVSLLRISELIKLQETSRKGRLYGLAKKFVPLITEK